MTSTWKPKPSVRQCRLRFGAVAWAIIFAVLTAGRVTAEDSQPSDSQTRAEKERFEAVGALVKIGLSIQKGRFTTPDGRMFEMYTRYGVDRPPLSDDDIKHLPIIPFDFGLNLTKSTVGDEGCQALARQPNLLSVSLSETKVTNLGIERLAACKNLTSLYLTGTKVTGAPLRQFAERAGFQWFLEPAQIAAEDFAKLADLPDVAWTISVSQNLEVYQSLRAAGKLHCLDNAVGQGGRRPAKAAEVESFSVFQQPKIGVAELRELQLFENLQEIYLGGTSVGDSEMHEVANFKNLRNLMIDRTNVTDAGMKELLSLTHLTNLSLSRTAITDFGLAELVRHPALRQLDLSGTRVTDAGLARLASVDRIDSLALFETAVTLQGLAHFENHPEIKLLVEPRQIVGPQLAELGRLKSLNWRLMTSTTDDVIRALKDQGLLHCLSAAKGVDKSPVRSDSEILFLELGGDHCTDVGVKIIGDLPKLKSLKLMNAAVTEKGFAELKTFKNLEALDLNFTKVPDASAVELGKLAGLKRLQLRSTRITDVGLKELKGLTSLEELKTIGTAISPETLAELKRALPNCKINE